MNLEDIILHKLEKNKYFHLYVESKENKWTVNKTKTENKLVTTTGERDGSRGETGEGA